MNYSLDENLFKRMSLYFKILFIPSELNDYHPLFLKSKFLVWAVILVLTIKIAAICLFLPFPKNLFFADITRIDVLNILNKNRINDNLPPLTENEKLNQAAYLKAQDMIKNGYFSHQSPQGVSPWFWFDQVGYQYVYAGENLAVGFVDSKNLYEAWHNSPSHRENLLNSKYSEVGSAIMEGFGGNNAVVVVQLFASPLILNKENKKTEESKNIITEDLKNTKTKEQEDVADRSENNGKRVLAETDKRLLLSESKSNSKNNFYFRFLNFIIYNNDYLRYVSCGFLIIIFFSLIPVIANFRNSHKKIIFKTSILIAALLVSLSVNENLADLIRDVGAASIVVF